MTFFCIADEITARGFRLAGIRANVAATAEQAQAAINKAVARTDCGIIIITENVALWVRPQIEMIRLERDSPLIVEIPGPEGPLPGHKGLREFVQEAVGIRVG
jgi:V/A-type H+/Na+-transporting ATPase subunit F